MDEARKNYYVYFAKSINNGKVYVGSTTKEPKSRVQEHNLGTNKWSKRNRPFRLIYYESYYCRTDALHREQFYKMGSVKD